MSCKKCQEVVPDADRVSNLDKYYLLFIDAIQYSQVVMDDGIIHKKCLKCKTCHKRISFDTVFQLSDEYYCSGGLPN